MADYIPDHWPAALIYTASTFEGWAKALAVAGVQATANIKVLDYQHKQYGEIRKEQRDVLDQSVENYLARVESIVGTLKAAYSEVPRAARFRPVNPCAVARQTHDCNLSASGRAAEWAACIAQLNRQSDLAKIVFFDPRWVKNVDIYAMTVGDLLRGRFPVSSKSPLLDDAGELSAYERRNGRIGYKTSRAYGLSTRRAKATGRDELYREIGVFDDVSPVGRAPDMRDLLDTPAQRIAFMLTQAQLVQNSLQNLFNQQAQKPPHRLAKVNLRIERAINILQLEASKATLSTSPIPNYAAILQPQINALAQSAGSFFNYDTTSYQPTTVNPTQPNYGSQVIPTK